MNRSEVLIVGAGPTGLVLALWLTKLGVKVRIVDKTAEPGTTSRALALQARTLELYRQLDLADAVVEKGHKVPAVNLWVKGERKARLPFETIGTDLTPYAFLEIFPQDQHERLLVERLQALGVSVERRTELVGFTDRGECVTARLRKPDGQEEFCKATYIAGCDGARSLVRETIGTGFPGGTYRQIFYVADVEASGPAVNGELHVDLDEADFLAVFPLAVKGRARLIGTVRDARADRADELRFDDVSGSAIDHLKVKVEMVNWFASLRGIRIRARHRELLAHDDLIKAMKARLAFAQRARSLNVGFPIRNNLGEQCCRPSKSQLGIKWLGARHAPRIDSDESSAD
jgi:2-polyprenyl-6-methoxyphenol hydroxylase-like FAD-dependent oxidoreductase